MTFHILNPHAGLRYDLGKPSSAWRSKLSELTLECTEYERGEKRGGKAPTLFRPGAIKLQGPYGSVSTPHLDYPVLVLVAGGIGATSMISLMMDLAHKQRSGELFGKQVMQVHLIWAVKRSSAFRQWWPGVLASFANNPLFRLHLFCTDPEGDRELQQEAQDARIAMEIQAEDENGRVSGMRFGRRGQDASRAPMLTPSPDKRRSEKVRRRGERSRQRSVIGERSAQNTPAFGLRDSLRGNTMTPMAGPEPMATPLQVGRRRCMFVFVFV